MLDLSKPNDLLSFLEHSPFASQKVVLFFGGSNHTFRLHLRTPYHGKHTAILKHGKPYVGSITSLVFDLERQCFEVEALRHARQILPQHSLVSVPEVYLHDTNAHIIIMEDCADGSADTSTLTLKEYLLRTEGPHPSPPTESTARTIGNELGMFLKTLHNRNNDKADVLDFFDNNKQARRLFAWATYGRLHSTLSGADAKNVPALCDPLFEISTSDLEQVGHVAKEMQELIDTSRETLVHGDFWPGNVIVRLRHTTSHGEEREEVDRVFVVDWELVKPGSRGVEIGQFVAELHQAERFCETNASCTETLRVSFLTAYKEGTNVDMQRVASSAMVHMGAHLVVLTPRVWKWVEKDRIREVVAKGVESLLNDSNREVLKTSPFSVLLSSDST
ncbi:kinase-like domain-containing protein [Cytidiella melzeri]|nr:kinase-like domain-containing protein [Cytidiella melzeri]